MKNSLFLYLIFVGLLGCKGNPLFLTHQEISPLVEVDNRTYPLSLLEVQQEIDVLFVVDNSGSMYTIQQNVIKNSKLFFSKFAKDSNVKWKIGLKSTDRDEAGYLGFDSSYDYTQIDPRVPGTFDRAVELFQSAFSRLGTNGSPSEYVFYNTKRGLDYEFETEESFLRPGAHLVVIMITDEREQSQEVGGGSFSARNFYNTVRSYVDKDRVTRFYGAFNFPDLESCSGGFDNFRGSEYEKIIALSDGFHISACLDNFGDELARIGEDIATIIGLPSLLLKQRPKIETLNVYYKDKLLPPGREEDGGVWFYDEDTNTIYFYHIDFVDDVLRDSFKIVFDIDDGISREEEE